MESMGWTQLAVGIGLCVSGVVFVSVGIASNHASRVFKLVLGLASGLFGYVLGFYALGIAYAWFTDKIPEVVSVYAPVGLAGIFALCGVFCGKAILGGGFAYALAQITLAVLPIDLEKKAQVGITVGSVIAGVAVCAVMGRILINYIMIILGWAVLTVGVDSFTDFGIMRHILMHMEQMPTSNIENSMNIYIMIGSATGLAFMSIIVHCVIKSRK